MVHEFFISRSGVLSNGDEVLGRFASEADAADMAVRFAQDNGGLYRIIYA